MGEVVSLNDKLKQKREQESRQDQHHHRSMQIGAAVIAVAGLVGVGYGAQWARHNSSPQHFMYERLVENGRYVDGSYVDIPAGEQYLDRPDVFDNQDGTSIAGRFKSPERVHNPVVITGNDGHDYYAVPKPSTDDSKRPNTVEGLSQLVVTVPVGTVPLLHDRGVKPNEVPLDDTTVGTADQITVAALE